MTEEQGPVKRRMFKLINNEVIFGEFEQVQNQVTQQTEILIKTPYTARNGQAIPYMYEMMGNAPGAVQIHPVNILWSVPLDEFDTVNKAYITATTGIETDVKSNLLI